MISQSNFIAGIIVIGFLFYITSRGQLSKYVAIFTGEGGSTPSATSTVSPVSSSNTSNSIVNAANTGTISSVSLPTPAAGTPTTATGNAGNDILYLYGDYN